MRKNDTVVTVRYRGIYLELEGYYEPGEAQTYDYPGSASEFESHKILVEDTDISELLDYEQIEELEQLAIKYIEDN